MNNKKFVFDTNFYRTIAGDACIKLGHWYWNDSGTRKIIKKMPNEISDEFKPFIDETRKIIDEYKIKENEKGIKVYPHIVVLAELIHHLIKSTDDNKQKCILALIAIAEHIEEENKYSYYATSEAILAKEMFEMYNQTEEKRYIEIINLVFDFKMEKIEHILVKWKREIENISKYIEDKENEFLKSTVNLLKTFDRDFTVIADNWQIFKDNKTQRKHWHYKKIGKDYKMFVKNDDAHKGLIINYLERVANYLGANIDFIESYTDGQHYELIIKAIFYKKYEHNPDKIILVQKDVYLENEELNGGYYYSIAKYCQPQLELLRLDLTKFVQVFNAKTPDNVNTIHDIDVIFSIVDEDVILVSNDNGINSAAKNTNQQEKAIKLEEYRKILFD
jgi:hypothetical protein